MPRSEEEERGMTPDEKADLRDRIRRAARKRLYRQEESIWWWSKALFDMAGRGKELLHFKDVREYVEGFNNNVKDVEGFKFNKKDVVENANLNPNRNNLNPNLNANLNRVTPELLLLEQHIETLRKSKNAYYKEGRSGEKLPEGVMNGGERRDIRISYSHLHHFGMNFRKMAEDMQGRRER